MKKKKDVFVIANAVKQSQHAGCQDYRIASYLAMTDYISETLKQVQGDVLINNVR